MLGTKLKNIVPLWLASTTSPAEQTWHGEASALQEKMKISSCKRCVVSNWSNRASDKGAFRLSGADAIAASMGIVKLVIAAIAVGFAVAVALAQNSTPELDSPEVAPNLKPLEPDSAQLAPNLESLSTEPNNPAMQTLKTLAPDLKKLPTQEIPDPNAPRPKTR